MSSGWRRYTSRRRVAHEGRARRAGRQAVRRRGPTVWVCTRLLADFQATSMASQCEHSRVCDRRACSTPSWCWRARSARGRRAPRVPPTRAGTAYQDASMVVPDLPRDVAEQVEALVRAGRVKRVPPGECGLDVFTRRKRTLNVVTLRQRQARAQRAARRPGRRGSADEPARVDLGARRAAVLYGAIAWPSPPSPSSRRPSRPRGPPRCPATATSCSRTAAATRSPA